MMEDDMKRNGSGYYDETPVKTGLFSSAPQAGEIWESDMGKMFLVLKNHGTFCTVLHLKDARRDETEMEVTGRSIMYTNPAMVQYMFRSNLHMFIKTVPEEKYLDIMQAVGERLGVTIKVSADAAPATDATAGNEDLLGECARLECYIDEWKAMCKELEARNVGLCDSLEKAKVQLEAEMKQNDDAFRAFRAADEKASLYEKMYNALLDRLFARGEAK